MLKTLLALATLPIFTPSIKFTSDSVYTKTNIISVEVVENLSEDEEHTLISKDLILKENHLLGYTIYDNKDTEYIDGLKVDGEYVYGWRVKDFDDSIEHSIQVKTVYTDDAAGMLVAAKDGNWTKLLSNPIVIFSSVYYILASVSLIVCGFGFTKSKKKKIKDHEQIAEAVSKKAELAKDEIVDTVVAMIAPLFKRLGTQNAAIIKALIMNKSKDDNDTLAMLDMLKDAQSGEDVSELVERIKIDAKEAFRKRLEEQAKAKETIASIADGTYKPEENFLEDDGTSI